MACKPLNQPRILSGVPSSKSSGIFVPPKSWWSFSFGKGSPRENALNYSKHSWEISQVEYEIHRKIGKFPCIFNFRSNYRENFCPGKNPCKKKWWCFFIKKIPLFQCAPHFQVPAVRWMCHCYMSLVDVFPFISRSNVYLGNSMVVSGSHKRWDR